MLHIAHVMSCVYFRIPNTQHRYPCQRNSPVTEVDEGSGDTNLRIKLNDLQHNSTSGNDELGPLGEWYEKDTILSGLDNSYILTGGQGDDVLGGGSQNDVLDGGEEPLKDQFGNDIYDNGVISLDRLVYYDAPYGINANLIKLSCKLIVFKLLTNSFKIKYFSEVCL